MKKILFTEKQIKSILGEDAFMYLDKEDNGMDFPEDSLVATGGEVLTNEPEADEFPTTDKIAASKTRSHPFYRNAGYGTMFEGKKKIVKNDKGEIVPEICPECGSKVGLYIQGEPVYLCSNKKCNKYFGTMPCRFKIDERNHQLDGKTYRLGKNINREIDNIAANNSSDKMLNNMSKNKDASANCLYVRQNRLRKMKQDDPERYKRINGKRLEKTIGDAINRATSETKTTSPEIQDPLMNTIQTARTGTGKGHRKDNGTTIYYENN